MLIWPLDSAERAAVFSLLSRRIRPQMVFARHLHVTRWLSVDRFFLEAADPVTDGGPSQPLGSGLRFQPWVSPSVRSRCLQSGCAVGGGGGELFPVKNPCFSRLGDTSCLRTYFVFHELSWFGPWCHLICHVMSHGSEILVYDCDCASKYKESIYDLSYEFVQTFISCHSVSAFFFPSCYGKLKVLRRSNSSVAQRATQKKTALRSFGGPVSML